MHELHLFAGAGGGILGGMLLGHTCVCAVEIDSYCRSVLLQRQRDSILPRFPIWDDVRTFDGNPWRGRVDIIAAGFPCQNLSTRGDGSGINGEKSGLWREIPRIVGEVQPSYVLIENSPVLIRNGLNLVLSAFAELGYDAKWGRLGASDCRGNHHRKRAWLLAYSRRLGLARGSTQGNEAEHSPESLLLLNQPSRPGALDDIPRMADGMAHRMDRLKAIGNGQVPAVAAFAWKTLLSA